MKSKTPEFLTINTRKAHLNVLDQTEESLPFGPGYTAERGEWKSAS